MYMWKLLVGIFLCVLAQSLFLSGGNAADKTFVLTFDDGPRPEVLTGNSGLLQLLQEEAVPAAFFLQGWQARKHPDLVRELAKKGHLVANHTYGHATPAEWARIAARKDKKNWPALSSSEKQIYGEKGRGMFLRDVKRGKEALQALTGSTPIFLRPPKWSIDQRMYCELSRTQIVQMLPRIVRPELCSMEIMGMSPYADLNTTDYETIFRYTRGDVSFARAVDILVSRVKKISEGHKDGDVFIWVFHEHKITTEALRVLISWWKQQGVHFQTLTEVYGL